MNGLFRLKSNENFHLLSFQFHTLDYSIAILKNKREEYLKDPIFKRKLDNYLMLRRLSFSKDSDLTINMEHTAAEYLKREDNEDLRIYLNISEHIIARELDKNYLISKIDFYSNYFRLIGNNLYCINNGLNTESIEFTDNDRQFLCSCAKKKNRIVSNPDQGIYNYNDISQQYIIAS